MKIWPALWLALALAIAAAEAKAETLYVSDQLVIGLHEEKTRESTILMLLTTGAPLEVLDRDEGFVKVTTGDGVEGWVDVSYLMEEKPASLLIEEIAAQQKAREEALAKVQDEVANLKEQLAEASSRDSTTQQQPSADEFENVMRELERLESENESLQTENSTLSEEITELKEQVASAQAEAAAHEAEASPTQNPEPQNPNNEWWALKTWHWVAMLVLFLVGAGLGAYIVDAGHRRRHGGYRV